MRWTRASLIVVVACGGSPAAPDAGPPGALDDGFGTGGRVAVPGGTATDVAIAADGSIVVFGASAGSASSRQLIVAHLDADGALGSTGVVDLGVADPLGTPDGGMAALADGRLALPAFDRLARSSIDGVVDTSFGSGGLARPPDGETWQAAIAAGDGTVVCGTLDDGSPEPLARRLDATGASDPSFGSAGRFAGSATLGTIFDCAADASGAIVLAGRASGAIAGRITADGAADPAFGSNGSGGFAALANVTDARAIAVGSGDYVVAGAVAGDFGIAWLSATGAVTATLAQPIAPSPSVAVAIAIDADQRVYAAGAATSATDQSQVSGAVVRATPDGALDAAFGSAGIVQLGTGTRVFAIAVQPDGKLVVAGDTAVDGARGVFVARLLP